MKIQTMFNTKIQSDIMRMIMEECDFEASVQVIGDFLGGDDLRYIRCLASGSLACNCILQADREARNITELFGF